MSIHVCSKVERTYETWLEESALRPQVSAYVRYLSEHGYSANTVGFYLHSVAHFSHWLAKRKIGLSRINEALVQRFITVHLPDCDCEGRCRKKQDATLSAALRHLLWVLRLKGSIPAGIGPASTAMQEELDRFDIYLERVCGLAQKTRLLRIHYLGKFLASRFKNGPIDLAVLKPKDIEQFVIRHGEGCTKGSIQVICSCMRAYLRFRAFEGNRTEALLAAVPRIRYWRLVSLPKGLTDKELEQFLSAFDRTTPQGRRNYAMARCLVDLGLRVGEVARLKLEHFDWRHGTLQIVGTKGRRVDILPLPAETGRAIVQYLRKARPKCTNGELFTRHMAPLDRPLTTAIVCWAMRCAYTRAGLSKPWPGSHALRHSFACRLLNAGASLKAIADLLRHRSLNSTTIYTKVDRKRLTAVALPWPGRTL
jgi:site-specific recombinase XerD